MILDYILLRIFENVFVFLAFASSSSVYMVLFFSALFIGQVCFSLGMRQGES